MNIKENIKEKFQDFTESHSKVKITIYSIVFLLVFSSLIIALASIPKPTKKSQSKKIKAETQVSEYFQEEDYIKPSQMNVTEEYYFSRNENENQLQDNQNWFTIPDENSINELHKANEEIVSNILGVAP